MKYFIFSLIFLVSLSAGTISNPTPIKNGEVMNIVENTSSFENYYIFTMKEKGSFNFSGINTTNLVTISHFNTFERVLYFSKNSNGELEAGTYLMQVHAYPSDAETSFTFFSRQIDGAVNYSCESNSSDIVAVEIESTKDESTTFPKLTKEYIDNLETGWNLLGTSTYIDDYSIFDSSKRVWAYKDGSWKFYKVDNDSKMPPELEIDSFMGFWLEK